MNRRIVGKSHGRRFEKKDLTRGIFQAARR
jgi:hypothetical protein